MNPSESDPHDEVPEFFPNDTWDDAGQLVKDTDGAASILPPRRPSPEKDESSPTARNHKGLRIGTGSHAREAHAEDVRLDVREIDGSVVRLEPEEPSQPKMPRHVVFHEQEPDQPREAEDATWGNAKKYSIKWIAAISVGIAVLVIAAISLLPLINRSNAAASSGIPAAPVEEPESAPAEQGLYDDLITRPDEAMRIFRKFTTAPDVEDFLPMVRDRSAVEPLIRSSWHAVAVSKRWSPENNARWEVHQTGELPFALLRSTMPDYSEFSAYFVVANEQLLIDWKATTGYGTATFEELATNHGNPAEIRGSIRPSGHYSPFFPEASFHSYLLEAPDTVTSIWCYTRRGEPVDEKINALFAGGAILKPSKKNHKVTLRLEHASEDALPNQWLIGELLYEDWISP